MLDRYRHFRVSLAILLIFTATSLRASDAVRWPVARGPSHEPVPYHYDPALWNSVPHGFLDDAPACILYSGTTQFVEPDGTVETFSHEVTRFNSRKAIEKIGDYRNIVFAPSYQTLTLHDAQVHKANGRTIPVEPRHVQVRRPDQRIPGLRSRQATGHLFSQPGSRRYHRGQMDRTGQEPRISGAVLHALQLRRR